MINTNDIYNRMTSINQTRQITRAMYLLSTTKVQKDAGWVEVARTYFRRVRSSMRDILEKSKDIEHRYMRARPGNRAAYIVIAGDKGLCGGYNHNVLEFALSEIERRPATRIITIGQVTKSFFQSRGYEVETEFIHAGQRPYLRHARRIVEHIFDLFDADEIDELFIIYTRYDTPLVQFPQIIKLLPIVLYDYANVSLEYEYEADMLYEPSAQEVFDTLIPEFAIGLLFGGMIQSYISEHTARLNAMERATKNADEMIEKLSLQYNRARQYAITEELSEIVSAAELMGGSEGY